LQTSESTVKDLLTRVSSLGLYAMQFDSKAQMWEVTSGPALEPVAWVELLSEGQRQLSRVIAQGRKENVVVCDSSSWTEPRRYPARRRYEKGEAVVVAAAVPTGNPGELHLGGVGPKSVEPRPAARSGQGSHLDEAPLCGPEEERHFPPTDEGEQTYHPGEVHLGIEVLLDKTLYSPSSLSHKTFSIDSSKVIFTHSDKSIFKASDAALALEQSLEVDQGDEEQAELTQLHCTDQPRCSLRSAPRYESHLVESKMNHQRKTVLGVPNPLDLTEGATVEVNGHAAVVTRYCWDRDEYLLVDEQALETLGWFGASSVKPLR